MSAGPVDRRDIYPVSLSARDAEIDRLKKENYELATRKSYKVKFDQFVFFKEEGRWSYGTLLSQTPGQSKVEVHYPHRKTTHVASCDLLSNMGIVDLLMMKESELSYLRAQLQTVQLSLRESELRHSQEQQKING